MVVLAMCFFSFSFPRRTTQPLHLFAIECFSLDYTIVVKPLTGAIFDLYMKLTND
jgi:hypothetical protein